VLAARWPLARRYFQPNSSQFRRSLAEASWLPSSLNGPFWPVAGTIAGTALGVLLIKPRAACHHRIRCKFDEDMMLDLANDIRSLSDFKRNTVDLLDRIRTTGNPMVLTVNGKAELIVQDAGAYQALLDRVEALEGIQRGVADVKAGRTKPAQQVFDKLRRKHGIPR
jgi:PHD/YefM family antitoxin component YafN of YafNO toxin-antitoxin module